MTAVLPDSVVSGRFKVLERPAVAPGKCAVCGAVDRPVIDFGMDLDYYGAVYQCVDCIREAWSVISAVLGGAESQGQVVPLHNPHLLDAGALSEYLYSATDSINRLRVLLDLIPAPTEDAEELSGDVESNADGTDRGYSEDGESVSSEGPDDVPPTPIGIFDV